MMCGWWFDLILIGWVMMDGGDGVICFFFEIW